MIIKKILSLGLLVILSYSQAYSQSIGIVYELSSFDVNDFVYNENPPAGSVKNILLNYTNSISESFQLSFAVGYGWNSYKSNYLISKTTFEKKTYGIPVGLDIRYEHFIERDSVFAPFVGFGIGYCYYITKNITTNEETEFKTKGFNQNITFGFNLHISRKIMSGIQFKKIMIHSISTKYKNEYERDYNQKNGFSDISISLGVFYNL